MTPIGVKIRKATMDDLPFILALAKRHSKELGFLPREAVAERIDGRRDAIVLVARGESTPFPPGEPAGFILASPVVRGRVRIFQTAVFPGFRRCGIGRALVDRVEQYASNAGATSIDAVCRKGLQAANAFYEACGLKVVHHVRRKPLSSLPTTHSPLATQPEAVK